MHSVNTATREIRYTESTKWDDARTFAINQWNALGMIRIAPDDAVTTNDLVISDVYRSDASWGALWTYLSGADTLQFNDYYMNGKTDFQRRAVAVHELGHALALDDHDSYDGVTASQSIMWYAFNGLSTAGINTPQTHDINDYYERW